MSDSTNSGARGFDRLVKPVIDVFDAFGALLIIMFETLIWTVRPPFRVAQILLAMDFVGVQSMFIVTLTGTFTGMVLALQVTHALSAFGAESVVGSIVAISLGREMSPVLTGLMVTARAGSAMAAEIGNMRVTEQIDALSTMGVSPVQYLISPRVVANVLMLPLLCVVFTCVGMLGAWAVSVEYLHVDPGSFLSNIERYVVPMDFWMGEIKAAVFGFLISVISCSQGFHATGGAKGVGQATTSAVVQSAVALIIANYILTSAMTEL